MKQFSSDDIDNYIKLLDFSKIEGGLIPVITQDSETNEILILAFANKEAVRKTMETGYVHFFSRSRNKIWKKGESSGYLEEVLDIITDCDKDSLLIIVKQIGAACHKGYYSCFFNKLEDGKFKDIGTKIFDPKDVYK
ncbi:MAG: phosphoribosyl-AMP cyclohydrolase [Candidatus Lokiarchaeota archaeon]|nr:phosphoribosyl-AMP cyclohydrolase [Candidatus Lokiarchaeota archaeon]